MKIFERIVKIFLFLIIFLLPLFFLPFSFEAFEFNKIFLLYFFTSFSLVFYLLNIVFKKEFSFQKNPLIFFVLAFLFFSILSAIFSVDKTFSLFGFYGRFSNGLLALIFLILFFFLILQNFEEKDLPKISLLFLISSFFVILISFLSIFGVFQKIQNLPPLMKSKIFNPVSGSLEGLSIFLVPIVFLSLSFLISKNSIAKKIFFSLILISSFSLLVISDFKPAFLLLILSLAIFLISSLISKIFRKEINKLLLPIFLILVSIFFLFLNPFNLRLPKEQILPQKISWQVSFSALKENPKSIFLGSGIGSFFYDFSKFKPAKINETPFWLSRFDRAGNHLAEILATTGIFGFFSFLILIFVFFLISFLLLSERPEIFPYLFTFLNFFLAQFFYYQNITLAFSFWLFLGLSVLSWQKPISKKTLSFEKVPELKLLFNTLLIVFSLVIFVSYYFCYLYYRADNLYLKALMTPEISKKISILERAVNLNPNFSRYKIDLASSYLADALNETSKPQPEQDQNKIASSIRKAINYAKGLKETDLLPGEKPIKGAVEISPNWVVSWETLGIIYREISPFVGGQALDWSIRSFEKAVDLESKNPILHTELGKLYLRKNDFEKAKEEFEIAINLKEDYPDAKIQYALAFEGEGKFDEAEKKLKEVLSIFPYNIEANFQLGKILFNQNKIDQAISYFERVISVFPNHSNSLYSLGVAYERKGEKEKALEYFQKVLKLNPGNQIVLEKIEQLKK